MCVTCNTHEGESFVPEGLGRPDDGSSPSAGFNSSEASFHNWLTGFLPGLSAREIELVKRHYPPRGATETGESYEGAYARAGMIYRDVVLACPAYLIAKAAGTSSWVTEYTISPAKHASDTYRVSIYHQGIIESLFCRTRAG